MQPTPTTRAVIDPSRRCGLKCQFCYYLHSDLKSIRPWEEVQEQVDKAIERGNTCADVTGGEPLLYPDIVRLAGYCRDRNFPLRIITSLIGPEPCLDELVEAGVRNWLVSMHGLQETHDRLVHCPHARKIQEKRLSRLLGRADSGDLPVLDFNCVITRYNQGELCEFAEYLLGWMPRIVNFINFNPHHEWKRHSLTKNLVADLRVVEPELNGAIALLERAGVGVNVRYYPMCRIAEAYRRCVSNDLHVVFDSGEWDYDIQPKTFEAFRAWGIETSSRVEEKGQPCCWCDLQDICGGVNKFWHAASVEVDGPTLVPQKDTGIEPDDFYHYRQFNGRGMA